MREGIPDSLKPDLNVAKNLWAKAFTLCDLPEAAHNLGVCYGLGHGGPVELSKAVEWYGAAKDCDLSGDRVGDARKDDAETSQRCVCLALQMTIRKTLSKRLSPTIVPFAVRWG